MSTSTSIIMNVYRKDLTALAPWNTGLKPLSYLFIISVVYLIEGSSLSKPAFSVKETILFISDHVIFFLASADDGECAAQFILFAQFIVNICYPLSIDRNSPILDIFAGLTP